MKTIAIAVAAFGLALAAVPAEAQDAPAPSTAANAPQRANVADVQRAARIHALFSNILRNEAVGVPAKQRYMRCLYNNSLGQISVAAGQAIAADAAMSDDDNGDLLTAASRVCGININLTGGDESASTPGR